MPVTERTPLLARESEADAPTEASPLLPAGQQDAGDRGRGGDSSSRASRASKRTPEPAAKRKRRWPSVIAILVLAALVVAVIVLGFVGPPAVQQYAESAVVLEPTSLSVESLTADGVRVRVRANLRLDASRVTDDKARRIGRFATGLMRRLATDETKVSVRLPHYNNALLGTALVPSLSVDLVDGHNNQLDFVTAVIPGDAETMRNMVNDWLQGKLHMLKVTGSAALRLKSGVLPLGTHDVVESMVFEANEMPSIPEYKVQDLVFLDVPIGDGGQMGLGANVSIALHNDYAIGLAVPSLGLQVLVPNCDPSEPSIKVATAVTSVVHVRPKADVTAEAQGIMRDIPESLTRACPDSQLSPLDNLMGHYLHGEQTQVFVRGRATQDSRVPHWVESILESITLPVRLPDRSFDNLVHNFSLTDVHFSLPSALADPNAPEGKPRVSGTIRVVAALPAGLNVELGVDALRARGDLLYKAHKVGELNLERWQRANSTLTPGSGDEEGILTIDSRIVDAPIYITDGNVFGDLVRKLLFGDDDVMLDVKSSVDVEVTTVLGKLVLKNVPAQGKIPVKHIPGDSLAALKPQIGDLRILNTSETGVQLQAKVNVTNPTPYTATIPYVNVRIMKHGYMIGVASARHVTLVRGTNTNMAVRATWDPLSFSGGGGQDAGRRLLSDYISGRKTTLQLQAHRGSIPGAPAIGAALARLNMTLAAPRLAVPGGDGNAHAFIRDATFHIFSSTATFTLASPLRHDTLRVERVNATAFYNHAEPIGQILDDEPFAAPPGLSQTPRLPVAWSASHIGLDKLRQALGGSLKLDALAHVRIRLGRWVQEVTYEGRGIGARVSL